MQSVTPDQLSQAILAFAIPSAFYLIHIFYGFVFGKRNPVLRPQPDWDILCISWLLFTPSGITFAVLAARTRDNRFLLCLKGVALLSVLVLEVH